MRNIATPNYLAKLRAWITEILFQIFLLFYGMSRDDYWDYIADSRPTTRAADVCHVCATVFVPSAKYCHVCGTSRKRKPLEGYYGKS
jgi:hypothetical protein